MKHPPVAAGLHTAMSVPLLKKKKKDFIYSS